MDSVGTVIVASVPPSPGAGWFAFAALLAMITAVAPASCAFFALMTKPQVPRSMRAIFPVNVPAGNGGAAIA